jgi:hypothetical protein
MVGQLCRCAAPGGIVSVTTGNAKAMAVRPAMERRWEDALASFDATEIGVLGVQGRADTVEELSEVMRRGNVEPVRWYGVWLFVDWLEFSGGTEVNSPQPANAAQIGQAVRGNAEPGSVRKTMKLNSIYIRPLSRDDLPLLHRRLAMPHVQAWWGGEPVTFDDVERKYGPRADGNDPTRVFVISGPISRSASFSATGTRTTPTGSRRRHPRSGRH